MNSGIRRCILSVVVLSSLGSCVSMARHGREEAITLCRRYVERQLSTGSTVSVLISAPSPLFSNSCVPGGFDLQEWRDSASRETVGLYTRGWLELFGEEPGFRIVNRTELETLLKEIEFQTSDMVARGLVALGRMHGANYLLLCSVARYCGRGTEEDVATRQLIEVETGSVVAADQEKTYRKYDPGLDSSQITKRVLNGREFVYDERDGKSYYR